MKSDCVNIGAVIGLVIVTYWHIGRSSDCMGTGIVIGHVIVPVPA